MLSHFRIKINRVDSLAMDLMVPVGVINYYAYYRLGKNGSYDKFIEKNKQNQLFR